MIPEPRFQGHTHYYLALNVSEMVQDRDSGTLGT